MQVEADPNQLRYAASRFTDGANELRQKAKRLVDLLNGLTQGQNGWKGEGAQGFSLTMEKIENEIQKKAGILEEAAQVLIQFAYQMDHVHQIRNQASNLERTLWSFTGDSEAAFQERQSISFQVNQLLQEADWQANAADAQATSALHSLAIPMPDFSNGISHDGSLEEELQGLSEAEKSYYRRHKGLISGFDENNSASKSQSLDRANMTAALVKYLKSKEPDYLPDDIREKAAMQDFNMLYADLPDDVLAARIQDIVDSENQAQHFQHEIQSGNYDQNALLHESGYTQYAVNQAYQQEPFGGMQGILEGMGLTGAFAGRGSQEPKVVSDNNDESQSQTSQKDVEGDENTKVANDSSVTKVDISKLSPLVKTEPNTAFFWSGKSNGIGGAEKAAEIAKSKNGTTLENLIETKGINMPEWDINNPESIKAWQDISAEYAKQVSGEVRAVVGNNLRKGNIWENVELPRLMSNPNVTKITTIDPETLAEKVIFER